MRSDDPTEAALIAEAISRMDRLADLAERLRKAIERQEQIEEAIAGLTRQLRQVHAETERVERIKAATANLRRQARARHNPSARLRKI